MSKYTLFFSRIKKNIVQRDTSFPAGEKQAALEDFARYIAPYAILSKDGRCVIGWKDNLCNDPLSDGPTSELIHLILIHTPSRPNTNRHHY